MQLQARTHRKSPRRRPLPFEVRALHSAIQARLNKSDVIPKTDTAHAGTLQKEMSVDATSSHDEQQSEPVTPQAAQAAECSTANYTRTPFDEKSVLPLFRNELNSLFAVGQALKQLENECHGKVQEKAIASLAEILGIRQRYFNPVEGAPEATSVLLDDLYQQCKNHNLKGRTKRTTEFHLFSRLLRGSDRKQASADAKILIRAHNAGQTAQTFAAWVAKQGSLSSILKGITDHEQAEQKEKREQSKNDKTKCAKRVESAVVAAAQAEAWSHLATYAVEDMPDDLVRMFPTGKTTRIVVTKKYGDQLHFYVLPYADAQAPAKDSGEDSGVTANSNS
ncbi:hypothetical protein [Paraburkholderia tropica]|uniref:hypothetical protein n=1 Tax=Paraburkholderia tropica TaxID=92647 RepID=UPI003D2BB514